MPEIEIAQLDFYQKWEYVEQIFLEEPNLAKKYEDKIYNGINIKMPIEMLKMVVQEKDKSGKVRYPGIGWFKIQDIVHEKRKRNKLMLKAILESNQKKEYGSK